DPRQARIRRPARLPASCALLDDALGGEDDAAVVGTAAARVGDERAATTDERHPLAVWREARIDDSVHVEGGEFDDIDGLHRVAKGVAVIHADEQVVANAGAGQVAEGPIAVADVVDVR